jgi:hypothetical protein
MKTLYLIVFGVIFFTTQILAQNNKDCTGAADCLEKILQEKVKQKYQVPLIQINTFEAAHKEDKDGRDKVSAFTDTKSKIRVYNQSIDIELSDFKLGFFSRISETGSKYKFNTIMNSCYEIEINGRIAFECTFFEDLPIFNKKSSLKCSRESDAYLKHSTGDPKRDNNKELESDTNDCKIEIQLENNLDRDRLGAGDNELYMDLIRFYRSN